MSDLEKPVIEFPAGPAPEDLDILDIVVGTGAEAVPGATVNVHYVGVEHDSGAEFDASWNRGESIEFPLQGLIQGWQEGIPGMKVGGRRQLTIPPAKAYGPAGSGHRLSGKTLIFVIDLLAVRQSQLVASVREVPTRDDGIRLGQFLKLADLIDNGAEAKDLIASGAVSVNGEVEVRRGRQLQRGDVITVGLEKVRVG